MKTKMILLSVAAMALLAMSFILSGEKYKTIGIGSDAPLPDKKMMDVTNKEYSLNDLKNTNGLCVIFLCNTRPFVVGSEGSEG